MNLTIRYFASLREALGERQELQGLPSPLTVAQLRARLSESSAAHAQALQHGKAVRCAVNQVMAGDEADVPDGAEVAFFPPVTGG
ncbi:MAG: MoaD/ThiS family protein [Burkholderiales bacterium]|jgi:molybdopterin synthase sulfur carrier subunit|nr:MoaD/ThiS family protein [Burkholderiales bacterium]NBO75560.1 MoaD/ThiS family protein [Betaproteobacteria bacterium]